MTQCGQHIPVSYTGFPKSLFTKIIVTLQENGTYLEIRISRQLKRGATEIVQVVIRNFQCTFNVPYIMIRKYSSVYQERGPDLGKATFRTLCMKGVTLDLKLYDEPIPAQRILSISQTQPFVVRKNYMN
jgi:hypothetical protein